ncbi:MAG: vitamin K epoxide reductase family protein, partial [Candidatus Nanohaloarchaea archaeon]
MRRRNSLALVLAFSLLGLLISVYQTYEHYFLATAICDVSQTFACSPVTESRFGNFPVGSNVATAFWGVLWWAGLSTLSYLTMKGRRMIEDQDFYLFTYISTGLAFIAYLLVVEFYILPRETGSLAVCPFCTAQHILILASIGLGYSVLEGSVRDRLRNVMAAEEEGIAGLDPKPVFIAAWAVLLFIGMFPILGTGKLGENHYELADCLADNNATMYGFDACPHCNRQKSLIGREAFKQEIDRRGFYVRCQPRSEAAEPLGERASKLSSVEPLNASTTQGEACTINVGAGTPTWVIDGEKYVGAQPLSKLAEAAGCPVPE